MEEVGLVDDEAYAGMLVRSQQAGRGLARRALAQTLRQKGVADEVAESVLDEVDPADEEERARELVEKRLRRLHGLDAVVQNAASPACSPARATRPTSPCGSSVRPSPPPRSTSATDPAVLWCPPAG